MKTARPSRRSKHPDRTPAAPHPAPAPSHPDPIPSQLPFETLAAAFGDDVFVFDAEARILQAVSRRETMLGLQPARLVGRTLTELLPAAYADQVRTLLRRTLESQQPAQYEFNWRLDEGERWFHGTLAPLAAGQVLCVVRDITTQRRLEVLAEIQRHILELIAAGEQLSVILEALAASVESRSPGLLCSVLLLDADGRHLRTAVAPSLPEAYNRQVDGLPIGPAAGSCGAAAFRREVVIVSDIEIDPLWESYRETAREYGLRACWSRPIMAASGRVLGTLGMYYREVRSPSDSELQLSESAARLASIAIERQEREDELRRAEQSERRRAAELEAVREATLGLTQRLEFPAVLDDVLRAVFRLMEDVKNAHIFLYDADADTLTFGSAVRDDGQVVQPWVQPRPQGLTYTVARGGRMIAVPDMNTHPLFADAPGHWGGAIVGFPLKIGERVVGVMNVAYSKPRTFDESELRQVSLLADQAAIAIENARLFEAERAAHAEAEALRQTSSTILTPGLTREQVLSLILEQLARVVDYDSTSIMLVQPQELTLAAHRGLRASVQIRLGSFARRRLKHLEAVIRERRALIIPDTQTDSRWQKFDDPAANYIRCWLGAPLVVKDEVIGVLNLDKTEPGFYTERHARLASAFATQAAVAIEHSRLYGALAQEAQRLQLLNQLGRDLSARLDLAQVYAALHQATQQLMPCDTFVVSLLSESRQEIQVVYLVDKGITYPPTSFPAHQGLSGGVVASGLALRIDDLSSFEHYQPVRLGDPDHVKSLLMVPMFLENRVIGALSAQSYKEHMYSAADEQTLSTLGQQAAIVIENARLYAETQRQLHDQTILYECAQALALVHDSSAVMTIVSEFITRRFGATAVTFYSYNEAACESRVDFEYWTEASSERERRSVLGQTASLSNYPVTLEALTTRTVQTLTLDDPGLTAVERISLEAFDGKAVITVPLVLHDRPVGFFEVWNSRQACRCTERDKQLLMALAAQAATALENTELYAATRRQSIELSTLLDAARAVSAFQQLDDVIELLARHTTEAAGAVGCTISRWDRERNAVVTWVTWWRRPVAQDDVPGTVYSLDVFPATLEVLEKRVIRLITAGDETADRNEVALLRQLKVASVVMLPLLIGDEVLGLVEVFDDAPARRFASDEINLIQGMVSQAAVAIANARLFDAVAQEKERLELLYDLSQSLADTLDPAEVGQRALARMCPVFGAFQGVIYVIEPATARLRLVALTDPERMAAVDRSMNLHVGEGLSGWVAQERSPSIVADVSADPRWVPVPGLDDQVRSVVAAPLVAAGQLVGVINLSSDRVGAFKPEQIPLFTAAAASVAAALHNARLFEETRTQADEMREASSILHALNAAPEVADAFPAVAAGLKRIAGCDRVSLALLDESRQMVTIAALDQARPELGRGATFPVTATAAASDVLAGRIHLTPDLGAETDFPAEKRLYEAGHRSRINLPLQVGERVIGALNLVWPRVEGYAPVNLVLIRQIADAVALAIEKKRFFDESRRRDAILESLAYAGQCLLMPGALADNLMNALTNLGQVIGVSRVYVFENHIGPSGQLMVSRRYEWCAPGVSPQIDNPELQNQPYTGALERWGRVLGAGRPLYGLVRDFPDIERPPLEAQNILSIAVMPIFSSGVWWGFLGFDDCGQERRWALAEIESLKSAAATLGAAFARQRSETAEREQRSLAEALRDTASALNSTLNFDEVLDRILENVGRVVPHDAANVLLLDKSGREAYLVRRTGYQKYPDFNPATVRLQTAEAPTLQTMAATRRPIIVSDTNVYDGWLVYPETEWVRSYLGAPIVVRGKVIGFLNVDSALPGFFTQTHADHLMAFANEAAMAIQNAQLFAATERHVRNAILLNEITRAALEAADFATGLQRLAGQMAQLIAANGCYITLWDEATQRPVPTAAYGAFQEQYPSECTRSLPGEVTLTGSVLGLGRPIVVRDITDSPYISPRLAEVYKGCRVKSLLALPLVVGNNKLGAVILSFDEHHDHSDDEVRLTEQAAGQVALAIFKNRLIESEREQRVMAEALRDSAGAINSTLNFDDVLERILENVGRVVPHDTATIMLVEDLSRGIDETQHTVRVVRARGFEERGLAAWVLNLPFNVSSSAKMQQMAATQKPLLLFDTHTDSTWIDIPETRWIRAWVGAPIVLRGRVLGFINLDSATAGFFTARHAEYLQVFANQAAVAIENAFLYDSIRQNADELAVLYRASAQLIRPGADLETLGAQVVAAVVQAFGVLGCALFVLDDSRATLREIARTGNRAAAPPPAWPLQGSGLVVEAARTRQLIYVPRAGSDSRYVELERDTQSALAAPLLLGERVIGVLRLESGEPDAFGPRLQRMVTAFAERAALALENSQLLARLDQARRAAEEASRLKSEFLANTSHELRTPLTSIIGSLSVILDNRVESEEEQRDLVQIAYASSEHLLQIINDVLDVARIEAGRMDVRSQAVNLLPLFAELYTLMRVQAEERKLRLDMHAPGDPAARVWADPEKLRQILINLIGNGLKFTERGGVTVRATTEADWMVITVQDTGIGIAPDKQARLFTPFVQADGSMTRKYGGAGLGLSISRRLAELMGGTLTLYSAGEGLGATLTLRLRLAKDQAPDSGAPGSLHVAT